MSSGTSVLKEHAFSKLPSFNSSIKKEKKKLMFDKTKWEWTYVKNIKQLREVAHTRRQICGNFFNFNYNGIFQYFTPRIMFTFEAP
jgi:hypothetical protein